MTRFVLDVEGNEFSITAVDLEDLYERIIQTFSAHVRVELLYAESLRS
jgi:hypothetical protein